MPISELNGMATPGTLGLCGTKERITRGPGVVHPARRVHQKAVLQTGRRSRRESIHTASRFRKTGNVGLVTHEQDSGAPTWF